MDFILSNFPLLLLILLSSLFIISTNSQYILPKHHFINCGSQSSIDVNGTVFTGDDNFSGGLTADNPTPNTPPIYQTARVFTQKSWYELHADANNSFVMVRLHFSPFRYNGIELSDSKFHVSVSGFVLLSDFNTGAITSITRDFIVPIRSVTTFRIEFTPTDSSSPAFVNAVEAFTTPPGLFRHGSVSATGENGEVNNVASSYAFVPVYRINVGGEPIDVDRDTLRRNWTPDDPYIFRTEAATNRSFPGTPSYNGLGSSAFDAPDDVYKTAKILTSGFSVNLTWSFTVNTVNTNAMYLVRAHFCDFISPGLSDANAGFSFFVNSGYAQKIKPAEMYAVQVPFYIDIVVSNSVESRFVNVSIGGPNNQTAMLNGLEIMELVKYSGVVDHIRNNDGKKIRKVYIVFACVTGGVTLVLVFLASFFFGSKCRRAKPAVEAKPEVNGVSSHVLSSYPSIVNFSINSPSQRSNLNHSLRFLFDDILQATNSFDEKLLIGRGGFGKVYRGTLPNGMIVAVKRGAKGHEQGRPEFVTEITVLSNIEHRYLVTLIGYCDEKSEMILVYEYMEKGTLQEHLYDENKDHPKLSWNQRLEICISATQGLHYLHTGSDPRIIHRDVKSTNILLNENYVAKVADFGISRLDNVEENENSYIKGSFGYLDPEYIKCMILTQKSDVYSFGVVLLEVLCARSALNNTLPQKEANLADWAIKNIKDGKVEAIMDPYLIDTINPDSLRKFLEIVERCLKDTGDERPNMINVLWDLKCALNLQQISMDKEPYEDSTMNSSLHLSMSMTHRLPSSMSGDDSVVNEHSAATIYPSESEVLS
ncbi:hypothetical protein SSX86_015067 [Deinandra increscens subsp. villosa]|uniref:Protein kinase domain-containing protein n=1 Tax=Deinandra increscens subsp. villosa TaxID=3103831 RepID=A0AAP0CZ62_9ASTR